MMNEDDGFVPSRGGRNGPGGRGGSGLSAPRPRTPFLDEFRLNGTGWTLSNVVGHVDELARDQDGSRFLQRQLDPNSSALSPLNALDDGVGGHSQQQFSALAEAVAAAASPNGPAVQQNSPEVLDRFFDEVISDPISLMEDVFGNYVIQKMFDVGNHEQVHKMAASIFGHVVHLTMQTYGCRVVQRAIQVFNANDRARLFAELEDSVAVCVQDQNGNHVIQKCVEEMPAAGAFIVRTFKGRMVDFATHAYGCRVIQCLLTHCPQHEAEIVPEIEQHLNTLACDQFGNYVVQHLIKDGRDNAAVERLIALLEPYFYQFSIHKFASNVMEKLYLKVSEAHREQIIDQLKANILSPPAHPDHTTQLVALMCDPYGNYVIQRLLESMPPAQLLSVVEHVKPYSSVLRRYTYGKHILARLERMSQVSIGGGGTGYRGAGRGGDGRGGGRGGRGQPSRGGGSAGMASSHHHANHGGGGDNPFSLMMMLNGGGGGGGSSMDQGGMPQNGAAGGAAISIGANGGSGGAGGFAPQQLQQLGGAPSDRGANARGGSNPQQLGQAGMLNPSLAAAQMAAAAAAQMQQQQQQQQQMWLWMMQQQQQQQAAGGGGSSLGTGGGWMPS